MNKLLTVNEVAEQLGVSPRCARLLSIPVVRIGRSVRYDPSDVARYAANRVPVFPASVILAGKIRRAVLKAKGAGQVYFLRCGDYVKVGHSRYANDRRSELQCGNPYEIVILGAVTGGVEAERAVQKILRRHRHQREWFHANPVVLGAIEDICRG